VNREEDAAWANLWPENHSLWVESVAVDTSLSGLLGITPHGTFTWKLKQGNYLADLTLRK
jgi:hypothetical protein